MEVVSFFFFMAGHCRLAETPECWSLEFQLDTTFADNFGSYLQPVHAYLQTTLSDDKNPLLKWNLAGTQYFIPACRGFCMPAAQWSIQKFFRVPNILATNALTELASII